MPVDVTQTLRRALSELQSQKERIDRQISAIRSIVGGSTDGRSATPAAAPPRRRRRMSASQRRAVSQRMKAYWAARRDAKAGAKPAGKSRPGSKARRPAKTRKASKTSKAAKSAA